MESCDVMRNPESLQCERTYVKLASLTVLNSDRRISKRKPIIGERCDAWDGPGLAEELGRVTEF